MIGAIEQPLQTAPCSECKERFVLDDMFDCSDLAPFAGVCCEECRDDLVEAGHFDTCGCSDCARQRQFADLVARMAAIEPGAVALP